MGSETASFSARTIISIPQDVGQVLPHGSTNGATRLSCIPLLRPCAGPLHLSLCIVKTAQSDPMSLTPAFCTACPARCKRSKLRRKGLGLGRPAPGGRRRLRLKGTLCLLVILKPVDEILEFELALLRESLDQSLNLIVKLVPRHRELLALCAKQTREQLKAFFCPIAQGPHSRYPRVSVSWSKVSAVNVTSSSDPSPYRMKTRPFFDGRFEIKTVTARSPWVPSRRGLRSLLRSLGAAADGLRATFGDAAGLCDEALARRISREDAPAAPPGAASSELFGSISAAS